MSTPTSATITRAVVTLERPVEGHVADPLGTELMHPRGQDPHEGHTPSVARDRIVAGRRPPSSQVTFTTSCSNRLNNTEAASTPAVALNTLVVLPAGCLNTQPPAGPRAHPPAGGSRAKVEEPSSRWWCLEMLDCISATAPKAVPGKWRVRW